MIKMNGEYPVFPKAGLLTQGSIVPKAFPLIKSDPSHSLQSSGLTKRSAFGFGESLTRSSSLAEKHITRSASHLVFFGTVSPSQCLGARGILTRFPIEPCGAVRKLYAVYQGFFGVSMRAQLARAIAPASLALAKGVL